MTSDKVVLIESPVRKPVKLLCEGLEKYKDCNFLGLLKGPGADFLNPTRNSRLYNRKLWENVFNDEWVKELIETRTLFGELDHPEERSEISIKESAVVLLEYSFNDQEGLLEVVLGILNTPNGRLLKNLVESGCQLGISSRGQGDLVDNPEGYEEVDPDSYIFTTFDVVPLPAVIKARPKPVEGFNESTKIPKYKNLKESLERDINGTESIEDLKKIKSVIESVGSTELKDLSIMIDKKLKENNISTSDNSFDNLLKDLEEAYTRINELESSNTITESKKENLDVSLKIKKAVKGYKELVESYESKVNTLMRGSEKSINEMKKSQIIINKLLSKTNKLVEENKELKNNYSKVLSENSSIVNESKSLSRKLERNNSQLRKLEHSLNSEKEFSDKKSSDYETLKNSSLRESKRFNQRISKLEEDKNSYKKAYIVLESKKYNLPDLEISKIVENSNTIAESKKLILESKDKLIRLNNRSTKIDKDLILEDSSAAIIKSSNSSRANYDDDDDTSVLEQVLLNNNNKNK